jgi:hypothetical protein
VLPFENVISTVADTRAVPEQLIDTVRFSPTVVLERLTHEPLEVVAAQVVELGPAVALAKNQCPAEAFTKVILEMMINPEGADSKADTVNLAFLSASNHCIVLVPL